MKLTEMNITAFSELLASEAPAPGGGSAAALEGALGIALTNMVAALTVGKAKYQEHQQLMEDIIKEATALRNNFLESINNDTEAFNGVSAVFSMPKTTEEEKAARKAAMQSALMNCTIPPYDMMRFSLEALELTKKAIGKSNTSAASDLGVAALSLKAAVQGAWLNILINIGGINDQSFAEEYRKKGQEILDRALPLADEIYETILNSL